MKKAILLLALLALLPFAFGCGGGAGSANVPSGDSPGVPSSVELLPAQFAAQTNSSVILNTKVLDGSGNPLGGVPVSYTNLSSLGVLSSTSATTNSSGIATVSLFSTTQGFVTVQAEVSSGVSQVRDRKIVFFSSFNLVLAPFLTLDVDGDNDGIFNEPGDGILFENPNDTTVTIRATVFDRFGQRVANSEVEFGSSSSQVTFPSGKTAITNQNGQASVVVAVSPAAIGVSSTVTITASADNGAFGLISLLLNAVTVNPSASRLTANPDVVRLGGTSTITAAVNTSINVPAPNGTTVNFSATCGTVTPFAQTNNGVATAQFIAPGRAGTCTITGSVAGVSIGSADVLVTTDLTVQPAQQTVNGTLGGTATFNIFGGVAPYTVTSNNALFPPTQGTVTSSGGNFQVTVPQNTVQTTVTYTVRDTAGATVTATLNIAGPSALSVQPGTQTINGVAGGTATFTILGGQPGYAVFSNNAAFQPVPPSVPTSSGTFQVTVPANTPSATVVFTIVDTVGATTTASLTIQGPPAVSVQPAAQTVSGATGGTATFTVLNGRPPYRVFTSNPAFPPSTPAVELRGGTFTVTVPASTPATTVTYTVLDSGGGTASATLTITAGPALSVQPSAQTVVNGTTATFSIFGGQQGYTVTSPDPGIAFNGTVGNGSWSVPSSGGSFTVTTAIVGAQQAVTLTVRDTAGATATATLTIILTPGDFFLRPVAATISTAAPNPVVISIIGGTPPFEVIQNSPAVLISYDAVADPRSFTVEPVDPPPVALPATVTITVRESPPNGRETTATVTVVAP